MAVTFTYWVWEIVIVASWPRAWAAQAVVMFHDLCRVVRPGWFSGIHQRHAMWWTAAVCWSPWQQYHPHLHGTLWAWRTSAPPCVSSWNAWISIFLPMGLNVRQTIGKEAKHGGSIWWYDDDLYHGLITPTIIYCRPWRWLDFIG